MARRPKTRILSALERDKARSIGADRYLRTVRFRALSEKYIFKALDEVTTQCRNLKFPDPFEGRMLGSFATVLMQSDEKVVGYLRKRKVPALDDEQDSSELWRLMGCLVAERFLTSRKADIPADLLLSPVDAFVDASENLFTRMIAIGQEMGKETISNTEMSVKLEYQSDPLDLGISLLEDAVRPFETLVPELGEDDEIPEVVERHSIAKAAFLHMSYEDLRSQIEADGLEPPSSKSQAADVLADRYAEHTELIAKIILEREKGDPDYGYVTRLMPLVEPPDLDLLEPSIKELVGRFFEARVASFLLFDEVRRLGSTLEVECRVRALTVTPDEAAGNSFLNKRSFRDKILIRFRTGQPWAEVSVRRIGDFRLLRRMLRRTGEVSPALGVSVPAPIASEFESWDSRTLWMLDFIRQDLQAVNLRMEDTLMANFLSPEPKQEASTEDGDGEEASGNTDKQPSVDAVRLKGSLLHEHPEACARIASGARLRDVDLSVRSVTDEKKGYSKLVKIRLSRDDDHISVLSGAHQGTLDGVLHREIVDLVRDAANRPLDANGLEFTLKQIKRRADAVSGEVSTGGMFQAATEATLSRSAQ